MCQKTFWVGSECGLQCCIESSVVRVLAAVSCGRESLSVIWYAMQLEISLEQLFPATCSALVGSKRFFYHMPYAMKLEISLEQLFPVTCSALVGSKRFFYHPNRFKNLKRHRWESVEPIRGGGFTGLFFSQIRRRTAHHYIKKRIKICLQPAELELTEHIRH